MIKAILNGCNGKMGRVVSEEVSKTSDIQIVAGIDKNTQPSPYGYPVFENIDMFEGSADLIIDFSRPESIPALVSYAERTKTALMVATTGLGREHTNCWSRRQRRCRFSIPPTCRWVSTWSRTSAAG
jgi:4-hydroxy-tetrahydrodipicolinate reductase